MTWGSTRWKVWETLLQRLELYDEKTGSRSRTFAAILPLWPKPKLLFCGPRLSNKKSHPSWSRRVRPVQNNHSSSAKQHSMTKFRLVLSILTNQKQITEQCAKRRGRSNQFTDTGTAREIPQTNSLKWQKTSKHRQPTFPCPTHYPLGANWRAPERVIVSDQERGYVASVDEQTGVRKVDVEQNAKPTPATRLLK